MLKGSLDAFALADVLGFIASGSVTGRLEIVRDEVGGELSVDQGKFVAARLTDEEAPSTVDEALDVAVLLFDGNGGSFEFFTEDWAGGPLDLDAPQLVKAVERRREEWAEVVSVLGPLDEPLVLTSDLPDGTQNVTLRAEQWRLVTLVDGCRSAQDIARDAASSVYTSARALAELAEKGMIAQGAGVQWQATSTAKRALKQQAEAAEAEGATDDEEVAGEDAEDPASMLRELGGGEAEDADDDDEAGDEEAEEAPAPPKRAVRATVRPLRAPTREQQRVRLRR
ncbi:MAG TPA: DUF4388 domain-containing protein [Actinomycetota bacterium]